MKSKDDSRQQTGMFVNLARGTLTLMKLCLFIGTILFLGTFLGKFVPYNRQNDPERDDRNALDRNWNGDIIAQKKETGLLRSQLQQVQIRPVK